jgi:hypothetical protein
LVAVQAGRGGNGSSRLGAAGTTCDQARNLSPGVGHRRGRLIVTVGRRPAGDGLDDEDELTAESDRAGRGARGQLGQRPPDYFLVELG